MYETMGGFDGIIEGHCRRKRLQSAIENGDLWLIYPLKMVIFHSYVSLSEGIYQFSTISLLFQSITIHE